MTNYSSGKLFFELPQKHLLEINTYWFVLVLGIGQIIPRVYVNQFLQLQQVLEFLLLFPWALTQILLLRTLKNAVLYTLSQLLLLICAVGIGVHSATNHLSFYRSTESMDELIYYYDEIFSHYLVWNGYFAVLLLIVFFGANIIGLTRSRIFYPSAIIHGLLLAVACIEGQSVYILYGYLFLLGVMILWSRASQGVCCNSIFRDYYGTSAAVAFVVVTAWGIYFGGFPEPSQLGLVK